VGTPYVDTAYTLGASRRQVILKVLVPLALPSVFNSLRVLFGLAFAWMATKLVKRIYQYRMETSARIKLVRDRNTRIRDAAEAIAPLSYPSNQQAIRVIREEVNRIEWVLADIVQQ